MRPTTPAVLALAAMLAAPPALAQTKWNLPTAYPVDNYHTQTVMQFAKDVAAGSNGALAITVHPNGSLFKAPEIKRAVQTGQAQAGEVLISIHENEDPLFGVDVVPFLATSFPAAMKLWRAQKPLLEAKLGEQGIKLLYAVAWPPQGLYTKKAIDRVEDMQGLKWRAYNVGTSRIGELVGAQPVTIQAAELPQALATGVVNAYMSSGSTGYDTKSWETLTHYYDTQAWLPKNVVFASQEAFDALEPPVQEAVLKAAAAAEASGWKTAEEKTAWYLDQFRAHGMTVQPPGPELKAGFEKIGEQLTADWLEEAGEEGQALIEAYRKP